MRLINRNGMTERVAKILCWEKPIFKFIVRRSKFGLIHLKHFLRFRN